MEYFSIWCPSGVDRLGGFLVRASGKLVMLNVSQADAPEFVAGGRKCDFSKIQVHPREVRPGPGPGGRPGRQPTPRETPATHMAPENSP